MTRLTKVRAIAVFEFLSIVRSKGWLIGTFGMPVFLLLYISFISLIGYVSHKKEASDVSIWGVLDEAAILRLTGDVEAAPVAVPAEVRAALQRVGQSAAITGPLEILENNVFRPYASEADAREAMRAKQLKGFIRIPADYLARGVIERYTTEEPSLGSKGGSRALATLLRDRMLAGRLPDDIAERIKDPVANVEEHTISAAGEVKEGGQLRKIAAIVIPVMFAVFLLISLMVSAGGLIQAMAVEKENKVVEVLLASANPDEILLGKLMGVGATGILQVTVWFGMIVVAALAFAATLAQFGLDVPWAAMGAAVLFFAVSYFFYGSLMLATGSIGSNQKEVQQWAMMWSILAAGPMIALQFLIQDPHGTVARVLSWVPFSAPITVVFRMAFAPSGIPWWEIVGPFVVLIGATWLAVRLGARMFRVGLLLTGARPKLREILRQARLS